MGLLTLSAIAAQSAAIVGPSEVTVLERPENTADEAVIATFALGDGYEWGDLEGTDAGAFTFADGVLKIKTAPNFEAQDEYNVILVALDDQQEKTTHAFTVTVEDVGPSIYGPESVAINEGTKVDAVIANFTASTEVAWELVVENAAGDGNEAAPDSFFTLSLTGGNPTSTGAALKIAFEPDYEAIPPRNTYNLLVTGMDASGEPARLPLAVTINDVGPTISGPAEVSVAENTAIGVVIASFFASETVAWSLEGADAGDFSITNLGGTLAFIAVPNYESPDDDDTMNDYEVTVVATQVVTQGQAEVTKQDVTVTVTDVGPSLSGPDMVTVQENDADRAADLARYTTSVESELTIVDTGTSPFEVERVGTSGQWILKFTPASATAGRPNYEDVAEYDVVLQASAGPSLAREMTELEVKITVTNVGPSIRGPAMVTVPENPANIADDAVIARYTTDDNATWDTLAGADANSFTFTNGSLAINDVPNYEDKASYAVIVVATDDNETTSLEVTVNVADDYGPEIMGPAMVEVDEHTAASAVIATYTTDDDAMWGTLAGADASSFTFTNGSLAINDVPNYEDKASYAVIVVATESGENKALMVTVTVMDLGTGEPAPEPAPQIATGTVTNTVTNTVTRTVYRDRSPAPAPAPAGPSIIGDSGYATTYLAVDGQSIELRIHPQAGGPASHTFAVGSYVRDADLGQTYQIVAGGKRRWVAPDSPLVYAIPWPVVNSMYTFSSLVVAAIPLDESSPSEGFLVRGQNGRIVSYSMAMWRHVPNIPTFQALGYRWCDVNNADGGFFSRISEGSPHAATSQPADPNYPSCG